jgi:hypothetical protein
MTRRRPTILTVMGTLNIVFGSIFLLCNLCCGMWLLLLSSDEAQAGLFQDGRHQLAELIEKHAFFRANVPGFTTVEVVKVAVGLVACVLLIIAGIGLLNVKSWGRLLSLAYSILGILVTLGDLVFTLALVNPAEERFLQGRLNPGNAALNNVFSVLGAIIGMAYPVVLLIMMLLPSVSIALAGRARAEDYDPDRREDEDDDLGRERRRREEGQE